MVRRLAFLSVMLASACQRQHVRIPPDACVGDTCATSCSDGETLCNGACVTLSSDPAHCGDCATQCPTDYFCVLGACSFGCDAPLEVCASGSGGVECVDTSARLEHCGGCGADDPAHICAASSGADTLPVCNSGECGWVCQPGLFDCQDTVPRASGEPTCASRLADSCHCGGCATSCRSWAFDAPSLTCASSGPVDEVCCGGGCTVLDSDTSCGTSCSDLDNCTRTSRNCCPTGPTTFGCVDENTDIGNCGGCGVHCSGLSPACCPLNGGGVSCIDTSDDPRHCGTCANDCTVTTFCGFPERPRCNSGSCGCGVL